MGCGTYLFFMVWGMGIICTLGSFIVQPRSQAPGFLMIGIGCLVVAILWTRYRINAPKKEAEAKKAKKLGEQISTEKEQSDIAHMEGLEKYHKIDVDDAKKYQEGIAAMRQLGVIMQQSVYQEKEKDWAILGGIADGIAGPAAGIATAVDAMQDNARIQAENAARREWGAKQNAFYQDLALQAERKSPTALSMTELQKKFEVIMSWSPDTLFALIDFSSIKAEIDVETGAVTVSVGWKQNDKTICIDGAFRAKLYTHDKICAGCAYLVLPKKGTAGFEGKLNGICARPKPSTQYTVKIEPVNLWELASKHNKTDRKTDNLSIEQHRDIVRGYETRFDSELSNA